MSAARGFLRRAAWTCCLAMTTVSAAGAQAYDPLEWSSIDSGGRMNSAGGNYLLSGTIGQHDAGLLTGGSFTLLGGFWRGGAGGTVDVHEPAATPLAFAFRPPAPNPVRSGSLISFDLPTPLDTRLRAFDLSGRAVQSLAFGRLAAGRHHHVWRAVDHAGRPLPSGLYFLRLQAGTSEAVQRVVVVR